MGSNPIKDAKRVDGRLLKVDRQKKRQTLRIFPSTINHRPSTIMARYAIRQSGECDHRSGGARPSCSVGSTPTRAIPFTSIARMMFARKNFRDRAPKSVGWVWAYPSGCNPPAFVQCRFDSCPTQFANSDRPVRLSVQDASLSRWQGGFNSRTGHAELRVESEELSDKSHKIART